MVKGTMFNEILQLYIYMVFPPEGSPKAEAIPGAGKQIPPENMVYVKHLPPDTTEAGWVVVYKTWVSTKRTVAASIVVCVVHV